MPDIVEIPAIWLQGSACTGCAVSLLNSFTPGASSLVLNELVPGRHISLRFIVTVMAGQGRQVVDVLKDTAARDKGGYVLVVEGSLPVGDPLFGTMGEENGREVPIAEHAVRLARNALAVVAMGTCAAFGGIPAGAPNPTEALSARDLLAREGVSVPVINIPGCPPHPDWLVGRPWPRRSTNWRARRCSTASAFTRRARAARISTRGDSQGSSATPGASMNSAARGP